MSTERHLLFAVLAFEDEYLDLAQLTAVRKRQRGRRQRGQVGDRGQVSFLGLPRGLSELSRPSRTALLWHQASVPNRQSRRMQFLRATSSASV